MTTGTCTFVISAWTWNFGLQLLPTDQTWFWGTEKRRSEPLQASRGCEEWRLCSSEQEICMFPVGYERAHCSFSDPSCHCATAQVVGTECSPSDTLKFHSSTLRLQSNSWGLIHSAKPYLCQRNICQLASLLVVLLLNWCTLETAGSSTAEILHSSNHEKMDETQVLIMVKWCNMVSYSSYCTVSALFICNRNNLWSFDHTTYLLPFQ